VVEVVEVGVAVEPQAARARAARTPVASVLAAGISWREMAVHSFSEQFAADPVAGA
jgi:hypothetical protein